MQLFDRLVADARPQWHDYTEHAFVTGMADGSLPEASFRRYLVQDYLFLIEFAKAYALAVYKADTLDDMKSAATAISGILDVEMNLHVRLCAKWGLTPADLEAASEATATIAYTRFVLDTGMKGDLLDLQTALSPCVIGYGVIAERLADRPGALAETNPYAVWISEYAGDEYQGLVKTARQSLDRLGERYLTEYRYAKLLTIFRKATRLESDFWQMGLEGVPELGIR